MESCQHDLNQHEFIYVSETYICEPLFEAIYCEPPQTKLVVYICARIVRIKNIYVCARARIGQTTETTDSSPSLHWALAALVIRLAPHPL